VLKKNRPDGWKRIKSLPMPITGEDLYVRLSCASAYSESLTTLTVYYRPARRQGTIINDQEQYDLLHVKIINKLRHFVNLNELRILENTKESIEEFDSFGDSCPSINFICIGTDYYEESTVKTTTANSLSSIKPNPDIKIFGGDFSVIHNDYTLLY
jgi:hypothetical protein